MKTPQPKGARHDQAGADRAERLARALRDNLKKRKEQARQRKSRADEGDPERGDRKSGD